MYIFLRVWVRVMLLYASKALASKIVKKLLFSHLKSYFIDYTITLDSTLNKQNSIFFPLYLIFFFFFFLEERGFFIYYFFILFFFLLFLSLFLLQATTTLQPNSQLSNHRQPYPPSQLHPTTTATITTNATAMPTTKTC